MNDHALKKTKSFFFYLNTLNRLPYFMGGILLSIIIYSCYIMLAKWNYNFVIPPSSNAVFWLPSGIIFTVFSISRGYPRIWPFCLFSFAIAEFTVARMQSVPIITATFWSLATVIMGIIVLKLTGYYQEKKFHLHTIKNVLAFFVTLTLASVSSGLVAAIGTVRGLTDTSYFNSAISWMISDGLGILLIAPVFLTFFVRSRSEISGKVEKFILIFTLLLISLGIYFFEDSFQLERYFFMMLISIVAWASIRFGPLWTSVVLLVIDLSYVWAIAQEQTILLSPQISSAERLLSLQLLVSTIGLFMLILAAAIEEQKKARRVAEEALKARDEFISIASHELKTPLSALTLQVQMLEHYLKKGGPMQELISKISGLTQQATGDLRRFSSLINDLLDVSRINGRGIGMTLETVNLKELVQETIERLAADLQKAGCQLTMSADESVTVHVDRLRLEQVISNLISNAIRYAPHAPINVIISRTSLEAICEIRDNGIGISKSDQQRIFDRFERVSGPETGGLGLGLFISNQIVLSHRGKIEVESEPGKGSTFRVHLPLN